VTEGGAAEADEIVLATEAWTPQLPGYRLTSLPLSSMMVATEPLPAETWEKIGWPRGLTVRDKAHLFLYAVRTEDDRIAIGGRGSPYRLSNPYEEFGERDQPVWDRIRRTIYQQFPAADGAAITHRWGGLLGVPRDWSMGIRRNQEMRITQAGGYAGHGVTATNISGRTIADLLLGRDTELTRLPWVNHRLRRWEPEPARYFAANSIVKLLGSADRHEKEHAKSAKRVSLVKPFMPPG
jgi:glycine/D-amino acid oxidase-like deaminating enzyme